MLKFMKKIRRAKWFLWQLVFMQIFLPLLFIPAGAQYGFPGAYNSGENLERKAYVHFEGDSLTIDGQLRVLGSTYLNGSYTVNDTALNLAFDSASEATAGAGMYFHDDVQFADTVFLTAKANDKFFYLSGSSFKLGPEMSFDGKNLILAGAQVQLNHNAGTTNKIRCGSAANRFELGDGNDTIGISSGNYLIVSEYVNIIDTLQVGSAANVGMILMGSTKDATAGRILRNGNNWNIGNNTASNVQSAYFNGVVGVNTPLHYSNASTPIIIGPGFGTSNKLTLGTSGDADTVYIETDAIFRLASMESNSGNLITVNASDTLALKLLKSTSGPIKLFGGLTVVDALNDTLKFINGSDSFRFFMYGDALYIKDTQGSSIFYLDASDNRLNLSSLGTNTINSISGNFITVNASDTVGVKFIKSSGGNAVAFKYGDTLFTDISNGDGFAQTAGDGWAFFNNRTIASASVYSGSFLCSGVNGLYTNVIQDYSGNIITCPDTLSMTGILSLTEKSANPPAPAEGKGFFYLSDGTGHGDDGDLIWVSTAGGTTNYGIIFDHSAGAAY